MQYLIFYTINNKINAINVLGKKQESIEKKIKNFLIKKNAILISSYDMSVPKNQNDFFDIIDCIGTII